MKLLHLRLKVCKFLYLAALFLYDLADPAGKRRF